LYKFIFAMMTIFSLNIANAKDVPLFSSSTESSTIGWHEPSSAVAKKIVVSSGSKDEIDNEIIEKKLKKNYQHFLSAVKIPLSRSGEKFLFIRPKSDVYSTFYGAHIFAHWIVDDKGTIIFTTRSDTFSILNTSNNGMHDIEESQCRGGYCYVSILTYNKEEYVYQSCITQEIATEKITQGCANP
jgi:hypothetical protein